MYKLNLHLQQIATLELHNVDYIIKGRNADSVTFEVLFNDDKQFAKAIDILIRR